jgi:hypothetical protein
LALESVADLTQERVNPEGEDLRRLARCTLGLRRILEHGSFSACVTMVLLRAYETYTDRTENAHAAWKFMASGLEMAKSVSTLSQSTVLMSVLKDDIFQLGLCTVHHYLHLVGSS